MNDDHDDHGEKRRPRPGTGDVLSGRSGPARQDVTRGGPYRASLDLLGRRRRALEEEERLLGELRRSRGSRLRELGRLEATIEDRRRQHALAVLGRVRIAHPCRARWEEMEGDARSRFCAQCGNRVYDLSAFDAAGAAALLEAGQRRGERLCVRLHLRRDGTIMTRDCGRARPGRVRLALTTSAVIAAAACAVPLAAMQTMGGVSGRPTPPRRPPPALEAAPRVDRGALEGARSLDPQTLGHLMGAKLEPYVAREESYVTMGLPLSREEALAARAARERAAGGTATETGDEGD